MRKLIFSIFCLTAIGLAAQQPQFIPYYVGPGSVYYDGQIIQNADPQTFHILRDGYATDSWNVYYQGRVVPDASCSTFRVLSWGYAEDAWNVYFDGQPVPGAGVNTFRVLGDWYACDAWNVYFGDNKEIGRAHV